MPALLLWGCGSAQAPDSQPTPETEWPPNAGETTRFVDDFEDLPLGRIGSSDIDQDRLFNVSRWTQLQVTAGSENRLDVVEDADSRQVRCTAESLGGERASKADLGKQNLPVGEGQIVNVSFRLFVEEAEGGFVRSTFFDLEDADELVVNGQPAGAGIRVRVDDAGFLQVDRGELVGSDVGEAPHFRLANMTSDKRVELRRWLTVRMRAKLGVDEPLSTVEPIDLSFTEDEASSWVELFVAEANGPEELVL
ncbi:MAG: hypothetical protein AAFY60_13805, partial [Myxococcota bacterium]